MVRCIFYAQILAAALPLMGAQKVTDVPVGPFHAADGRIVDALGRPFLIRGTELEGFRRGKAEGPFAATTLSTLRLRFNMNAVRLPLDLSDDTNNPAWLPEVGRIVRTARQLELLVILAAPDADARFWSRCAAFFKNEPNVFFDISAGSPDLVKAIRAEGATQPIVVSGPPDLRLPDPNIIYGFRAGADDGRGPLLASIADLDLDHDSAACHAVPSDPATVERTIRAQLDYFDAHAISWIASTFQPGKLITDYRYLFATTLDDGWTCGRVEGLPAGMGHAVQFHLWNGEPFGLFTVTNPTGGMVLPRGGVAAAYGPTAADEELGDAREPLPTTLGNISLRVTDAKGVGRTAQLLHVSAGWGYLNFIVPPESAPGPAEIAIVRSDGTQAVGNATIADVSPGLFTAPQDGHGPVSGWATQTHAGGKSETFPIFECHGLDCRTIPILLSKAVSTTVRIKGTGFRNANPGDMRLTIGDIAVPVLGFRPGVEPGADEITIALPATLGNLGETDLLLIVNGHPANVARINVCTGGRRP